MHTQSSLSEVKISDVLHLVRATHRWLIFSDTDIERGKAIVATSAVTDPYRTQKTFAVVFVSPEDEESCRRFLARAGV